MSAALALTPSILQRSNRLIGSADMQAVASQSWTHDPTMLPDAYVWPTWGALRERVLQHCKTIHCKRTPNVRDAFAAELVTLSPGELVNLSVRSHARLALPWCAALTAKVLPGAPAMRSPQVR